MFSLTRILTERFNWSKSNILCERTKKKLEVIMDVVVVDKVVEEVNKVVEEVNKELVMDVVVEGVVDKEVTKLGSMC